MRTAWLVECGRMEYGEAWTLQRSLLGARQADHIPDTVLLLEHPPVITIGRAGRASNILVPRQALAAQGVEVFDIERGGDVTYHGPGQLVGYPIINLRALDEDVVRYVRCLESALINAVAAFGIAAARVRGYPGVWVGDEKIAAIGVAVKRKVTMHGFALNVDPDLSFFGLINPCGLGKPVTSIARCAGRPVPVSEAQGEVVRGLSEVFQVAFQPVALDEVQARIATSMPVPST
jgi:lipoate-protein ligase B